MYAQDVVLLWTLTEHTDVDDTTFKHNDTASLNSWFSFLSHAFYMLKNFTHICLFLYIDSLLYDVWYFFQCSVEERKNRYLQKLHYCPRQFMQCHLQMLLLITAHQGQWLSEKEGDVSSKKKRIVDKCSHYFYSPQDKSRTTHTSMWLSQSRVEV